MVFFRVLVVAAALLPNAVTAYSTQTAYGLGKAKFDEYRSNLPKDFNVVAEGGWYSLTKKYSKFIIHRCLLRNPSIVLNKTYLL